MRTQRDPRGSLAALGVAVVLVLVAACGRGPVASGGGDAIAHPADPDVLILRVETTGGFVPIQELQRRVPGFSLYGDGTIVTQGPQIEIYPPPAMPAMLQRHVDEVGIQAILRAARDAGLFADRTYDDQLVSDATTTVFTVNADGRRFTTSVYAHGFGDTSGQDRAARADLVAFDTALGTLPGWLPEGSLGPEQQYQPDALRLFVGPAQPDDQVPQNPVAWPLSGPLQRFGTATDAGMRCGVVEGADLQTVLPDLAASTLLTPWESLGRRFQVIPRPLLPDESGC
ncbi:MAG: hypothetical protein WEA10_02415 [Actinomycetota bacterium]